jgi:hypothetical protein
LRADECRASVRGALRHVLRLHGHDEEALDPFYYPTDKQYERVSISSSTTPLA